VRGCCRCIWSAGWDFPRRGEAELLDRQVKHMDQEFLMICPRTIGRVFTALDGKSYRPSMFLTLTCDSCGKVRDDGTPVDPSTYDHTRAARDALHFSALVDRFIQNLRRVLGYDAQYFGAVEPQKRLAPHLHMAIRGAVPRAIVRQVIAATYHQVWWPSTEVLPYDGDELPVWDEP
jgi:hypothetical protein